MAGVIGFYGLLFVLTLSETKQEQKLSRMTIFWLVCVCETYPGDCVIIHHYCVKNLIHRFDDSNYPWQAALLSCPETWTRSSLALQFSFPLTPVPSLKGMEGGSGQTSSGLHMTHYILYMLHDLLFLQGTEIAQEPWPHIGMEDGVNTKDKEAIC